MTLRTRPLSRRAFVRTASGALLAPGALACAASTEPDVGSTHRLTARAGIPHTAPDTGEIIALDFGSAGGGGFLYVPTTHDASVPMPLFVGLHGAGGAGDNWTSYAARAEARGMIMLAPDARGRTWDVLLGGFGPDVAFLDAALAYTFERCRVDPSRVALGGFSDGASYALSLGAANGDLFSHVVAYSPGFWAAPERVDRPEVFVSHGRSDAILPYAGTEQRIVPDLRAAGYGVTFLPFDGPHSVPASLTEAALDWFVNGVVPEGADTGG